MSKRPVGPLLKEEVKWRRENMGLTISEASALLKVNPMFLSQLESGERQVSEAIVLKMNEIYGNPENSPLNQWWKEIQEYNIQLNRLRYHT